MSKTLGAILNTFYGPISGLVINGKAGFTQGLANAAAALSGPVAFGAYVAGAVIQSLKSTKAETTSQALRTERPPRFSAYGRVKMYGAYMLFETAGDGTAVDVWAFHDGRIDAIEAWYLGDKLVVRLPNGFVQKGEDGAYGDSNIIQIGANLGAATETAHAAVVAKLPGIWTPDHRGDGIASGYMISAPVKAKNYQATYPSGGPNQTPLAIVIRAQPVFDWRDPAQSVADPLTWRWSENAVLHLVHYKLVREAIGPTRPPSHPDYWSDLAALYGARWGRLFEPTIAYLTAAADDADIAMPLRDGGSELRYRSCVSHRHAGEGSEHKSVNAAIMACFDGWTAVRPDGAMVIRSGRYYTPTVSIGPDQIVSYTVEDGIEDENAVNQIGVTYVSSAHDFNTVDTDPWTDEDDILARGAVRSDDIANQVPSHAQARRLAKRQKAKAMAPKRGKFVLLSGNEAVLSERYVVGLFAEALDTDDEFVAYAGPIEITSLSRNLQTGAISGAWIAADENVDAWNPATEEGEPAPTGDRVAREPLDQPAIISATAQYSAVGQTPEGEEPVDPAPGQTATGARILIASTGPDRVDLTWFARWRVGTSGSWNEREYADADPGPAVSFLTEFVPLASNINVQVAYSVGDGRLSPWSNSAVVNTTTA